MDLDESELKATKKMREEKCKYCDLKNGDEIDLSRGNEQLVMERQGDTFVIVSQPYYEDNEEVKINYCPICGRKLV